MLILPIKDSIELTKNYMYSKLNYKLFVCLIFLISFIILLCIYIYCFLNVCSLKSNDKLLSKTLKIAGI